MNIGTNFSCVNWNRKNVIHFHLLIAANCYTGTYTTNLVNEFHLQFKEELSVPIGREYPSSQITHWTARLFDVDFFFLGDSPIQTKFPPIFANLVRIIGPVEFCLKSIFSHSSFFSISFTLDSNTILYSWKVVLSFVDDQYQSRQNTSSPSISLLRFTYFVI